MSRSGPLHRFAALSFAMARTKDESGEFIDLVRFLDRVLAAMVTRDRKPACCSLEWRRAAADVEYTGRLA